MLKYLLEVIRNLLTTGILTALLFASFHNKGEEAQRVRRRALWGCAAGAVAALVLAVLRRTTALINRSFFNTWILSFAVLFAAVYLLFLWGALPRTLGEKFFQRIKFLKKPSPGSGTLPEYTGALLLCALFFYALPTIFLYLTEFVLAGESIFSTDFLFKFIGYSAGLLAVILTGLGLYKTAKASGPAWGNFLLKIVLTAVLVVNICNQAASIVQFLLARRIIPRVRWLFMLMAAAINNNIVFLYVLMGLSFLLPLIVFIKSLKGPISFSNPAERRKNRSARRINRRWCVTVAAGFALSVFSFTFIKSYIERGVVLSPAEPMTIQGEEILIPITQVEDGHLHRFEYTASDSTGVRFIVIKKNAVAYGVGLDACDICGPTGYYERKNEVICRLCDVVMNISTIGFKGGCNPVPLAYTLRSGSMVIEIINLENEKIRFK
jgi:uncharacterized membrane protein